MSVVLSRTVVFLRPRAGKANHNAGGHKGAQFSPAADSCPVGNGEYGAGKSGGWEWRGCLTLAGHIRSWLGGWYAGR